MSQLGIGKMGWRNLWRNPRRTLVTVATMTVRSRRCWCSRG
jgi:hypothetical protein